MFNILPMGNDCSSADASKKLKLRKVAFPFDWIKSTVIILEECFKDNFVKFHKNIKFNDTKTRLIDEYGFEFPHDYPNNTKHSNDININIDDVYISESCIIDNYKDYYDIVLQKYNRRIERFKNIINDTKPIIVLCRYDTKDVLKIQELFIKYYKKDNIYFLNSTFEIFENSKIKNIYTEENNIWNETNIWKSHLYDLILNKLK